MVRLFVGGIPYRASEGDVEDWFKQNEVSVENVAIPTERETGKSRGFAFAEVQPGQVEAALELSGAEWNGRQLTINEAREKPRTGGRDRGGYGRR